MALVSLDTMVMIWALRKTADPGQEYRLAEAARLLEWLESEKHRVMLSANAVAEYLTGLDEAGRLSALASIPRGFHVQPFDMPAAAIAAKIQTDSDLKKIAKAAKIHYQCLKSDVAIIASSISAKAEFFITEDVGFKSINDGRILVKSMSEVVKIKESVAMQTSPYRHRDLFENQQDPPTTANPVTPPTVLAAPSDDDLADL